MVVIKLYLFICVLLLCQLNNNNILSQTLTGGCTLNKVLNWPNRYIFTYVCQAPAQDDPPFPTGGSSPTEFTEIQLSPNLYTSIPIIYICQFSNITLLDMSYNKLTSLTGVFQSLNCISGLKTIILSNNNIQTSLTGTDFDDSLAARLEYLDLSNNKIPSIDTSVFIKSTGTSRFINLKFLSLKNNLLKEFDLLWPLTLSNSALNVDLSVNPIDTLTNKLGKSYNDVLFSNPATGTKIVNIRENKLQTFSDSNLLQYGLQNANDLSSFLNKIENYDFRQTNNLITCSCSASSLKTVVWYQQLLSSSSINTNALINQITCSNFANTYPLNINCNSVVTTTTTKVVVTSVTTIGNVLTTSTTLDTGNTGFLVGSTSSSLYYLFFLLLIPLFLLIFIILCCLRPCNKFLYANLNTVCFRSYRPGESSNARLNKEFDATIVYSEYDETWVHENIIPIIARQGKAYKLHLLTTYHKGFSNIEKDQVEKLKASKRIILVFSKNFLKEEWKNNTFQNALKNLCAHDSDCVIIPLAIDDETQNSLDEYLEKIEEYYDYDTSCFYCNSRIKHSTTLENIERIDVNDENFSENIRFVMPIVKKTGADSIITDSSHIKRNERTFSPFSLGMESENSFIVPNKVNHNVAPNKHEISINSDRVLPFKDKKKKKKFPVRDFLSPSEDESNYVNSTVLSEREPPKQVNNNQLPNINETPKPNINEFNVDRSSKFRESTRRSNLPPILPEIVPIKLQQTDNLIIPVVKADEEQKSSRKHKETTELKEVNENNEKKHKHKHKHKKHHHHHHHRDGSVSRRSKTESFQELNIMPITDDHNVRHLSFHAKEKDTPLESPKYNEN